MSVPRSAAIGCLRFLKLPWASSPTWLTEVCNYQRPYLGWMPGPGAQESPIPRVVFINVSATFSLPEAPMGDRVKGWDESQGHPESKADAISWARHGCGAG